MRLNELLLLAAVAVAGSPEAAAAADTAPLEGARYAGRWYELARFDSYFQRGCEGTTATYVLKPDGEFRVENRCFKNGFDAKPTGIDGKAWTPNRAEPGKLKVQFVWPFSADYWVLEVAEDYSWALVGNPNKDACWMLSRTPHVPESLYQSLLGKLRARGYDTTRLLRTSHPKP